MVSSDRKKNGRYNIYFVLIIWIIIIIWMYAFPVYECRIIMNMSEKLKQNPVAKHYGVYVVAAATAAVFLLFFAARGKHSTHISSMCAHEGKKCRALTFFFSFLRMFIFAAFLWLFLSLHILYVILKWMGSAVYYSLSGNITQFAY